MAGVGFAMLNSLKAPVDAAIQYDNAFRRFKELNLGTVINEDAKKFTTGANLYGVSAKELTDTLRDMHAVMGHYDEAKLITPRVAQLTWANSVLFSGRGTIDESQARAIAKVSEMRGGKNSPADFNRELELAQHFISGTGGAVMPSDLYAFSRRAGTAMRGLSDEGFLKFEPLIQEMTGAGAGTAFMSAYQNLVAGRTTKRAAMELMQYGLLDPKKVRTLESGAMDIRPGALKDSELFKSDMIGWVQQDLLPALAAKGMKTPDQIVGAINTLLTNRTGSNEVTITATQMEAIMRNWAVNKKSFGVDATINNAKESPAGQLSDFSKRWTDFKQVFGEAVIPFLIVATDGLKKLTQAGKDSPRLLHAIADGFVALGGAMAFGGTVILLKGAFGGLSALVGATGSTGLIGGLGAVTKAFGWLSAAAFAAAAGWAVGTVANEGISWLINKLTNGKAESLGDWAYGLGHTELRNDPTPIRGRHVGQPPIHTTINLDGRKIAEAVSTHQARSTTRTNRGASSSPDFSMTLPPVAFPSH